MLVSMPQLLSAAFFLASTTKAVAVPALQGRAPLSIFWIGFSNQCIPVGDGNIDCINAPYISSGEQWSCDDRQVPMDDDMCSSFADITTPLFTDGKFVGGQTCSESQADGEFGGILASQSQGNLSCQCFRKRGNSSLFCGTTWANDRIWECQCYDFGTGNP